MVLKLLQKLSSTRSGSRAARHFSTERTPIIYADPQYAPHDWDPATAVVYADVISEKQHDELFRYIDDKIRKQYYRNERKGSFLRSWKKLKLRKAPAHIECILKQVRRFIEAKHGFSLKDDMILRKWLMPNYVVDIHTNGTIHPHTHPTKYAGNIYAGLNLYYEALLRLRPVVDSNDQQQVAAAADQFIDLLVPKCGLFVLSGMSRYSYTHELGSRGVVWLPTGPTEQCKVMERNRYICIIFRDGKKPRT